MLRPAPKIDNYPSPDARGGRMITKHFHRRTNWPTQTGCSGSIGGLSGEIWPLSTDILIERHDHAPLRLSTHSSFSHILIPSLSIWSMDSSFFSLCFVTSHTAGHSVLVWTTDLTFMLCSVVLCFVVDSGVGLVDFLLSDYCLDTQGLGDITDLFGHCIIITCILPAFLARTCHNILH